MKRLRQAGFSTAEAIILGVVVVALVGIGVWVATQQINKDDAETSQLSDGEGTTTPAPPEIETAGDLDAAEKALNDINLEAGNSDNAELDVQSSDF